jgi:hypothetical protein
MLKRLKYDLFVAEARMVKMRCMLADLGAGAPDFDYTILVDTLNAVLEPHTDLRDFEEFDRRVWQHFTVRFAVDGVGKVSCTVDVDARGLAEYLPYAYLVDYSSAALTCHFEGACGVLEPVISEEREDYAAPSGPFTFTLRNARVTELCAS